MKRVSRWKRRVTLVCATGTLLAAKMAFAASPWVDLHIGGSQVPVRLADGQVQCASTDGGSGCGWGATAQHANRNPGLYTSLSCGPTHASRYDEKTGYDTSTHWCSIAFARFYADWKPGDYAKGLPAYSINPDGDVQCYSTGGSSCNWDVLNPGPSDVAMAVPLACGKMHDSLYDNDGYSAQGSWCAQLRDIEKRRFFPSKTYGPGDYVEVFGRLFQHCPNPSGGSTGVWPVPRKKDCGAGDVWNDLGWLPSMPPAFESGKLYQTGDTVVGYGHAWTAEYTNIEPGSWPNYSGPGWQKGLHILCEGGDNPEAHCDQ